MVHDIFYQLRELNNPSSAVSRALNAEYCYVWCKIWRNSQPEADVSLNNNEANNFSNKAFLLLFNTKITRRHKFTRGWANKLCYNSSFISALTTGQKEIEKA